MEKEDITGKIIKCAYKVHNTLGFGFLEKVYENALAIELRKMNFDVKTQLPISVYYNNEIVGEYFADIVVNDDIILELKAVSDITNIHEIQLVNYLQATKMDLGLLINFGESVQIKRKYRLYQRI